MNTSPRRWASALLGASVGLVGYTYAGYPAVLWALHRRSPRAEPEPLPEPPKVSLIVAAYNEEAAIGSRLENLAKLDYPDDRLEILVVADGSTDATADVARDHGVEVLHRPERAGKAAALDRGVAASSGEYVVFSDANNHYAPETLRALLAPFADPGVGVATGTKMVTDDMDRALDQAEGLYWRYESAIKRWESSIGSVTGVAGEVIAIRRAAWRPLPKGTVNDDFTMAMIAAIDGWDIAYAPDALSLEPASATLDDETTRRARIVSGRYQALARLLPRLLRHRPVIAWQVISHKGLRPLVPLAMAGALAGNLALLGRRRYAPVVAAVQATFYGLAAAGAVRERREQRPSRATYLPYYLCRVNAAAARGMAEVVRRRNITLWERVPRGGESGS